MLVGKSFCNEWLWTEISCRSLEAVGNTWLTQRHKADGQLAATCNDNHHPSLAYQVQ